MLDLLPRRITTLLLITNVALTVVPAAAIIPPRASKRVGPPAVAQSSRVTARAERARQKRESLLKAVGKNAIVFGKDTPAEEPQEKLEPWVDSHSAVRGELDDQYLLSLASDITAQSYGEELRSFVGAGPSRFVTSPGNARASDAVEAKFKSFGLNVTREELRLDDGPLPLRSLIARAGGESAACNIVGVLPGTDLAHEVVLVGAHSDSANWE
eukprot:CAMPEP_0179321172 /NCGR_PEP_ID=MMETSP0797-20121207/58473_1 /TAXON_ID=47934 /ORGANISM="Dinophysis acuminata, Strain DAEP01" /LENGTH=212 /DNA_ID=CAMNT_0021032785 /DNA_START=80 /DNA_END=715 /DNA_ORIENTATION=-